MLANSQKMPAFRLEFGGHIYFVMSLALLMAVGRADALPVDEVLPLVGTGDHGHTYPGATVPFGFVQLSPDTRTEGWDACAGYHFDDTNILGFSHTHISGAGCADLGDLLVLPVVGEMAQALDCKRFKSGFSHDQELAQPGYYRVRLDKYDVLAELTATAHAGMHRYTFPASSQSHILIDLVHGLGSKPADAELKVEGDAALSGFRRSDGWAKDKTIYFVVECSAPFKGFGLERDGAMLPPGRMAARGKQVRGRLDFATSTGQQIVLRVGLSPTSIEEARKNLQQEIPGWDFDALRADAKNLWNENLSRIEITSANPNVRQTFYSALYHTMAEPTLYNNVDGSYRGADGKVHAGGWFQYYSTFSLWDTFRAEHPLLTLTQPERVNDFVRSLLAFYQQSPDHQLPMWPLAGWETGCMIGYHAVPVIVDAWLKGFTNYDRNLAYQAMRDAALSARNHQQEYQKLGYVPAVTGKRYYAAARTLEFAYDDWCLAQMAEALGKTNDATLFLRRSQNFTNVFDRRTGFFRGRTAAGTFREPFNPRAVSFDDFIEANAWQYAFAVPQDVPGMIRLYGGDTAFIRKLDQLFNADSEVDNYLVDVSGLVGQYSHGNEPDQHFAYLYDLAGAPWKTQQRVRQILLTQYDNSPEGICGNDDCGQISAWYVWSALGLYPLNPVGGRYLIGSPLVEKAVIQLDPKFYPGGKFVIIAHNASRQNCYIQSAELNGKPLHRIWITHAEITSGGRLEFEMGIRPDKTWGLENKNANHRAQSRSQKTE
jgi:predicted alpha-1,2-mannosidase